MDNQDTTTEVLEAEFDSTTDTVKKGKKGKKNRKAREDE
jgi:hypothetical protein